MLILKAILSQGRLVSIIGPYHFSPAKKETNHIADSFTRREIDKLAVKGHVISNDHANIISDFWLPCQYERWATFGHKRHDQNDSASMKTGFFNLRTTYD